MISVLIPFHSDDPHRQRACTHVTAIYRALGWEVIEGDCAPPWRKAIAVHDAAQRAHGDVFVIADADCLSYGTPAAADAVADGAGWAMPHFDVHRLDQQATSDVYTGVEPSATTGRAEQTRRGVFGGGIVVVARETWRRVPLDVRFVGWGQEDVAWARALTCLAGPVTRLTHDLWHLWHPEPARLHRNVGSTSSLALYVRYGKAMKNPARMAALIDEGRTVTLDA